MPSDDGRERGQKRPLRALQPLHRVSGGRHQLGEGCELRSPDDAREYDELKQRYGWLPAAAHIPLLVRPPLLVADSARQAATLESPAGNRGALLFALESSRNRT